MITQSLKYVMVTLIMLWVIIGNGQTRCDIIHSRYYDKIVSIKLQEMSGIDSYQSYKTIYSDCGLDNSVLYRELQDFAVQSLQVCDFECSEQAIRQLITNYGYKLADFKQYDNFNKFRKYLRLQGLKHEFYIIEQRFVSDTSTYLFFEKIGQEDQSIRKEYLNAVEKNKTDTMQAQAVKAKYSHLLDSIDHCNCRKILNYYDTASVVIMSQEHRQTVFFSVLPLLPHCANTSLYEELCMVLRKGIDKKLAFPEFLAAIVDRRQLNKGQKYIYGFYDNLSESNIEDVRNLDNRRLDIGLPSYYVEKQWKEKLKHKNFQP